ncbi:MAG: hypothetical protein SGPRY_013396 [Prymnesium sp.]
MPNISVEGEPWSWRVIRGTACLWMMPSIRRLRDKHKPARRCVLSGLHTSRTSRASLPRGWRRISTGSPGPGDRASVYMQTTRRREGGPKRRWTERKRRKGHLRVRTSTPWSGREYSTSKWSVRGSRLSATERRHQLRNSIDLRCLMHGTWLDKLGRGAGARRLRCSSVKENCVIGVGLWI